MDVDSLRRRGEYPPTPDPDQPVEGYVELPMGVEEMWRIFNDVPGWPQWNKAFWKARAGGGQLKLGVNVYLLFNPMKPGQPYKVPAIGRIVEYEPFRKVTWLNNAFPGIRARHSYIFEDLGPDRCRFGSWEVVWGPLYERMRAYWIADIKFVCDASLEGAQALATSGRV